MSKSCDMTKEQAIEELDILDKSYITLTKKERKAIAMAISALSDTRPNIHARWEPIGEAFQCSHCGTSCAVTETATEFINHIEDKFCRGCGAMMDEKGSD